MRSIEGSGLGLSDFAVLEVLLNKGPQKVNDIGRRVDLTSGSITAAVDRLATRGLVVRELDDADRRSRIVRLTPAGRAHIGAIFTRHAEALEAASSGLTKTERKALIELLKKLGLTADETWPGGVRYVIGSCEFALFVSAGRSDGAFTRVGLF
jgi:MarR family 2-MHQ and catechol resistance regulon transcriptional repressor